MNNLLPEERTVLLGKYIALSGATVRDAARVFGISKSTVHTDVSRRLKNTDRDLWLLVRRVLDINKAQRHIRGGLATKEKYLKEKQNGENKNVRQKKEKEETSV